MNPRTVYAVLDAAAQRLGSLPALHQPQPGKGETRYHTLTWVEYRTAVQEIAAGLQELGVELGEVVALYSETRLEFYLCDIGIMSRGAIAAALYTAYPAEHQAKTLQACRARWVIVESPKLLQALRAVAPADLQYILMAGEQEGVLTLAELREKGCSRLSQDAALFTTLQSQYGPDEPAMLYLTSGATGEPKMGLVTHRAITANIDIATLVLQLGPQDRTIAFLPSAHITQRLALEVLPILYGMPIWFSESLSKLPSELKRVKPTFFVAPPRVWERIYTSVCTEVRKRPAYAQKMFYGALGAGLKAEQLRQEGKPVPGWLTRVLALADRVIFQKIRERLGGELRVAVSGSAPLSRDIAMFYAAIGMPLVEGYGLTEGGITHLNPPNKPRVGSIGQPLPGALAKLSSEGELLLSGPTLFAGYFGDETATRAVMEDGWLHTGDIAEADADGFYYITGRKKELIVSSNGKKIYPARIESFFKVEPLVSQILLVGDRLPYLSAFIVVNTATLETLEGLRHLAGKPLADVAGSEQVVGEVQQAVARVNAKLAPFEQIRKFRLLANEFTIDRGELTPTMKVRRSAVLENYRPLVEEMYQGKEEFVS